VPVIVPYEVARSRTGLGLFATHSIRRGTWVVEYTGPLLPNAEATKKEDIGARYLFEVNNRWTIDGAPRTNIARYANHSCKPNMESEIIGHRVFLRAIRSIEPGDELTYNYGRDYLRYYIPVCKCAHCMSITKGRGRPTQKKNGKTNGHANGHANGKANGHANGKANGHANGNGHC
jgi:hypothetical protein